ncbi:MAG: ABC transporter permease [Spirochaetales bacterium]|nr:ABC transporter permease [Spirochaetales bacterium]
MALFRIAWRNLKEHKVKTLIIGILITFGITILVIGNSMIDTAALGIEKNYIDNYTGHLIITGESDSPLTLFGAMSFDRMNERLPVIPNYFQVLEFAKTHPDVLAVSGQGTGMARISIGEEAVGFTILFGIDPGAYLEMFPGNLEFLEGGFLKQGEEGLILSERIASLIEEKENIKIRAGDHVLLTGISAGSGAKIRELTVRGIFRFISSNMQLNMVSLIDIDSLRSLNGMTLGAELVVKADDDEVDLIEQPDEDDMFGQDDMINSDISYSQTEEDLLSILGDTSERDKLLQTDSGAWHFLLLKLKNEASIREVTADFNRFFKEKGILEKISGWKSGAGPIGEMANTLKIIFNVVILIIACVAVIIIMNTLVISINERMFEIGTMRALGAQKGFVRGMIIMETILISIVFGAIGIMAGTAVLGLLGATGITAPNMFFEVIFGGKVFYPVISPGTIIQSMVVIILIGMISSLYPVWIALKIQPVKAIHSD